MLQPVEPLEAELSAQFLRDQFELTASGTKIRKLDYSADGARTVLGLAPYFECWEEHRSEGRLPSLSDFDAVLNSTGLSAVHLVDTPTGVHGDFRFVNFDSSMRHDGHDFTGTYLSRYPDSAFKQAARIDYSTAVATAEACLSRLDFNKTKHRGGMARLVLPISDENSASATKLMVVLRLFEHLETDRANDDAVEESDEQAASRDADVARWVARALGGDELVIRYFKDGLHEQLDDEDLLEWLLRPFIGYAASQEVSRELIGEFGSLPGVLAMGRERLPDFPRLTHPALLSLKVVRELATRLIKTETMSAPIVSDSRQVIDYCRARMAHERVEHLRILYLDQKNQLIRDEVFHGGGVSSVSVDPRQIIKRAVMLDAQSIIMAHNHPSGDPNPSAADVEVTRDVRRAAESISIRLLDHLIVGRSGSVSLRTLGYLDDIR